MERKTMYLCDPERNAACKKTRCVHNPLAVCRACYCTTDPVYAVLDEGGTPITVPDWSLGQVSEDLKYLTRMLEEDRQKRAKGRTDYRRGYLNGSVSTLVFMFLGALITMLLQFL